MAAPVPVTTLPAKREAYVDESELIAEPRAKMQRPEVSPRFRPKRSDKGPHASTESPAQTEYPVKRNPMSWEDFPTWARIAGSKGLRVWLSATPRNRMQNRQAMTLAPRPAPADACSLFVVLDA